MTMTRRVVCGAPWLRIALLLGVVGFTSFVLAAAGLTAAPSPQGASTDRVKRGEYLVIATGCHDCHTPHNLGPDGPEPDMSRALSGQPAGEKVPPPPAASDPWIVR